MKLWKRIRRLVTDPPPEYVFEVSESGIAWVRTADPANVQFASLPEGTVQVNPLVDNIRDAGVFQAAVRSLAPGNGRPRRAALILPDYAARIAVVEFDTFPVDAAEQSALVRFRIKRSVPFDVESAVVAFHAAPRPGARKVDVTVAALPFEIASKYEAPFRAAGFHCGLITVSALAALALPAEDDTDHLSPSMTAKLSGRALSLSLFDGPTLRMFRCVELPAVTENELEDVIAPTFAFAEDELGARPRMLKMCGFPRLDAATLERWTRELDLVLVGAKSQYGRPAAEACGLYGLLETLELN